MFLTSKQRDAVLQWIETREEFPTRKQTQEVFKNFPQKIVRAAYQAARDRRTQAEDATSNSS